MLNKEDAFERWEEIKAHTAGSAWDTMSFQGVSFTSEPAQIAEAVNEVLNELDHNHPQYANLLILKADLEH